MTTPVEKNSILYDLGVATARLVAATKDEIDSSVDDKIITLEKKIDDQQKQYRRRVRRMWFAHINKTGGL